MTEDADIKIEQYSSNLAAGIAEMFNSWDDLWPGGFTSGVPYDEERVRKTYDKIRALAILIAIDSESDKPVGFCSLMQHWRDEDAAYIGLLGVSPEALSKKVGKRLLLRAMKIAIDKGYQRVDLHTWAGNLRAVPLYKKIGLMWNPEADGVHLEGFIPEILKHPLAEPFWNDIEDINAWYEFQQRELEQAPDDIIDQGMHIYNYQFETQSRHLSVIIDRLSKGITSIDCKTDEGRLKVSARVEKHLTICGIPSEYILTIENELPKEIKIKADLKGFEGLHFEDTSSHEVTLASGKTHEWRVTFYVDSTTELYRKEFKSPSIITNLMTDDVKSELTTGLKIHPAAEIRTRWHQCLIEPGTTTSLPVTIVGHGYMPMQGEIKLEVPAGLNVEMSNEEFELDSEGISGSLLKIVAEDGFEIGTHDIWLQMVFDLQHEGKDLELKTRKFRIPIFCVTGGRVAVGLDDLRRRIVVAGHNVFAYIERDGARATIMGRNATGLKSVHCGGEIGPPFGLSPFREAEREFTTDSDDLKTTVSLKAKHPDYPMEVEDLLIFHHDTSIVEHQMMVTNISNDPYAVQQQYNGGGGGISFNAGFSQVYIPLSNGIVSAPATDFSLSFPAIATDPESYKEQWVALDDGEIAMGQIWLSEGIEDIRIGNAQISRIVYESEMIQPGEKRCLSKVWNVPHASSWSEIRDFWSRLIKKVVAPLPDLMKKPETSSPVEIQVDPVVVYSHEEVETKIKFIKSILPPIQGTLVIEGPKGWDVRLKDAAGETVAEFGRSIVVPELQLTNDLEYTLTLKSDNARKEFMIETGKVTFHSFTELTKEFHVIQMGESSKPVVIEEIDEEGLKVFKINNDVLEFKVSAEYGGCLYSLKNKRGVELLHSAFPKAHPFSFVDNFYGGVQPLIWDEEMNDDLEKARTNKEKMSISLFEQGEWKGVEVSWIGEIQQTNRGAKNTLRYLTSPGCPIILVDFLIENITKAPMRFYPTITTYPSFDGKIDDYVLSARWGEELVRIRPSPIPTAMMPMTNFAKFEKGEDGLGIIIPMKERRSIVLAISELVIAGPFDFTTWLLPGESTRLPMILFIDPPDTNTLEKIQEIFQGIF